MIDHRPTEPLDAGEPFDADEVERLVNEFIDETLDQPAQARLAELLRRSPAARAVYRETVSLHASLAWDHAPAVAAVVMPAGGPPTRPLSGRSHAWWGGAGMMVAALVGLAAWMLGPGAGGADGDRRLPVIARVESAAGAVLWAPARGRPTTVTPGMELTAGTFLLEEAFSHVAFRFLDGSRCYATREAEFSLRDDDGKRLDLRHGELTVDAVRQPAGRPMVLTTPETRVEVVGTSFVLGSENRLTTAAVVKGTINVRPLGHGATVGVQAGQEATADLVRTRVRPITSPAASPVARRISFASPPADLLHGVWRPDQAVGGLLRAEPFVAGRLPGHTPIVHSGISLLSEAPESPLAPLAQGGGLRLRLRSGEAGSATPGEETADRPLDCRVMLTLTDRDGRFAGIVECRVEVGPGTEPGGWNDIEIPWDVFMPLPVGDASLGETKFIKGVLVANWLPVSSLEAAEIEFLPPKVAGDGG